MATSKWTPKDAAEREAVVALCERVACDALATLHCDPLSCAERIVPPVPYVLREVPSKVASGLAFRCLDGVVQAKHASMDGWVNSVSIHLDDFDVIANLKANPTVTPPPPKKTPLDSIEEHIARGIGDRIGQVVRVTLNAVVSEDGSVCVDNFCMYDTPPTRERAEPVAYANRYAEGYSGTHDTAAMSRKCAISGAIETAVPLYRHPATIDDAITLLVREGWADDTCRIYTNVGKTSVKSSVRVLIAPTPTGAAHE